VAAPDVDNEPPMTPLVLVVGMVAAMWAEEIVDLLPHTNFDQWGIRPRTTRGLVGVALAPFLHAGFPHLIGNTVPFLVLGSVIAIGGTERLLAVVVGVALISGMGVWLFGQSNTVHIGASGVVFGFVSYLVSRGFFARKPLWLLGGVLVLVVYGGIVWGLFPRAGISWEGHLFGAIGGVVAAKLMHGRPEPASER
jgi:membrane associated rhomboid family serine protease